MKVFLSLVLWLVFAAPAKSDSLTSAVLALANADKATDRCDVADTARLLHKNYRGMLALKQPDGSNHVLRFDRDESIEMVKLCASKRKHQSATKRLLRKAELTSAGRVLISGDFEQNTVEEDGKSEVVYSGSFMSELVCFDSSDCLFATDAVMVQSAERKNTADRK